MKEFRKLSSMTIEEAKILIEECFDGELLGITHLDDEYVEMEIMTSGWNLEEKDNPKGEMIDAVGFAIGVYSPFKHLVDIPFSGNGEESKWQEFMIYYGFHPYYKSNVFEKTR